MTAGPGLPGSRRTCGLLRRAGSLPRGRGSRRPSGHHAGRSHDRHPASAAGPCRKTGHRTTARRSHHASRRGRRRVPRHRSPGAAGHHHGNHRWNARLSLRKAAGTACLRSDDGRNPCRCHRQSPCAPGHHHGNRCRSVPGHHTRVGHRARGRSRARRHRRNHDAAGHRHGSRRQDDQFRRHSHAAVHGTRQCAGRLHRRGGLSGRRSLPYGAARGLRCRSLQ